MSYDRKPFPISIDLSNVGSVPHQSRHLFLSLDEVLSQPSMPWLIKNLIGRDGLTVIYGKPGSGKTFLVLALTLSIGHGMDCFGRRTLQGGVAIVAGEGSGGLRNRIKAWHDHHGLDPAECPGVKVLPNPVNMLDPDAVADLIKAIAQQFLGVALRVVVIDTLARCFGDGNECLQPDMSRFVEGCDLIRRSLGCAVIVIHHTPKEGDDMRGSGALEGATDTALRVSKTQTTDFEAFVTKQKDGLADIAFGFQMVGCEVGRDEDDEPTTSLVAVLNGEGHPAAAPVADAVPAGKNQSAVLAVLAEAGEAGLTGDEWRDAAKASGAVGGGNPNRAFREARDALVRDKLVLVEGNRFLAA